MNCLESRRLLLAFGRGQSAEHQDHVAACPGCAHLARQVVALAHDIENAALVPLPEGLTHRILLRRRSRSVWRYSAAAVIAAALAVTAVGIVDMDDTPRTTQAVGPTHPAIAAISEAIQERPEVEPLATDPQDMPARLKRLGLALKPGEVSTYYIGKCRIEGSGDCEHIVLSTSEAHADVLLVMDYPLEQRLLVEDRSMTALVNPAGSGGYIVVAQSPRVAKRVNRLFVKG